MNQIELVTAKAEEAAAWLAECVQVEHVLQLEHMAETAVLIQRQHKAATAAHANAWELKQRCVRRIGQLTVTIPHHPTGGGRPRKHEPEDETCSTVEQVSKGAVLESMGITRKQAAEYEQAAAIEPSDFEARVQAGRQSIEVTGAAPKRITAMTAAVDHDGDSWGTPPELIAMEREVLGGIDLDPATNETAQLIVDAARYYTKENNGLTQPWKADTLHLNQPYSMPWVAQFSDRFVEQYAAGAYGAGIMTVNAAVGTAWFDRAQQGCVAWCAPSKRIAFIDPATGKPGDGNRQGQAIFYNGPKLPLFARVYAELGTINITYAGGKGRR